jgi:hypothetical protein
MKNNLVPSINQSKNRTMFQPCYANTQPLYVITQSFY